MSNTDPNSFAPDLEVRGVGSNSLGKISLTSEAAASRLITPYVWAPAGQPLTITYAFRRDGTPPDEETSGFQRFTATQIAATETALTTWMDVANIRFVRMDDGDGYSDAATILFGGYTTGSGGGYAFLPGARDNDSDDGDIWLNVSIPYNQSPARGNYGMVTLVHEIGHVLGLGHPGDYDGDDTGTYEQDAGYAQDNLHYTIMSYFTRPGGAGGLPFESLPSMPQTDDITAVQRLYGANMATRAGDTIYGNGATADRGWVGIPNAPDGGIWTVWDGGGIDTFDFSNTNRSQVIDLRQGGVSMVGSTTSASLSIRIAYGAVIENAKGGLGDNTIIGNGADNVLTGGRDRQNKLYGEGGNDTLIGGADNDLLDGGSGVNRIDGGGGHDTMWLAGSLRDHTVVATGDGGYTITGNGITNIVRNVESVVIGNTYYDIGRLADLMAPDRKIVLRDLHSASNNDFNGDGYSDILLRDKAGAFASFIAPPDARTWPPYTLLSDFAGPGSAWSVVATLDWNGDGRSDVLLRDTAGAMSIWQGGIRGFTADSYTNRAVRNDWQIVAVTDLDGDRRDDLVWRDQSGAISLWQASGGGYRDMAFGGPAMNTQWRIAAAGDVNGDGFGDLVWRHDDGLIATWLGTGSGGFRTGDFAMAYADPAWRIVGIGNVDGKGPVGSSGGVLRDDLVFRNDDRSTTIWVSTGAGYDTSTFPVQTAGLVSTSSQAIAGELKGVSAVLGEVNAQVQAVTTGYGNQALVTRYSQAINPLTGTALLSPTNVMSLPYDTTVTAPSAVDRTGLDARAGDLTGDGHADILWRDRDGGISVWTFDGDGRQVRQGMYNSYVPADSRVAATFDYNGDGREDVLIRYSAGSLEIWAARPGGGFNTEAYRHAPVPAEWRIAATGDLNGDGRDDILWQARDGQLSSWVATDVGFAEAAWTRASPGAGWQVAALLDTNGDGLDDILWRNTDGGVAVWTNADQGIRFNEGAFFQRDVPTAWHVDGVGDVNGDGRDDIFWRHDNGGFTVWLANGGGFDQGRSLIRVDPGWTLAQIGDLNADGRADIVWRHADGHVSTWQANDSGFDQAVYNSFAATNWAIAANDFIL